MNPEDELPYRVLDDAQPSTDIHAANERRRVRRLLADHERREQIDADLLRTVRAEFRRIGLFYLGIALLSFLSAVALYLVGVTLTGQGTGAMRACRALGTLYAVCAILIAAQTLLLFRPTYRRIYGRKGFVFFVIFGSIGSTVPILLPLTIAAAVYSLRIAYRDDIRGYLRRTVHRDELSLWG